MHSVLYHSYYTLKLEQYQCCPYSDYLKFTGGREELPAARTTIVKLY